MRRKPLIATNPHLKNRARYRRDLITNVSSSTAIETGAKVETVAKNLPEQPEPVPIRIRRGSAQ
jgi:hypothetical protein